MKTLYTPRVATNKIKVNKSNASRHGRRNTPGRSARQVTKRRVREEDGRWQAAMGDVRSFREELEARLAWEAEHPTEGAVPGAEYTPPKPNEPKRKPRWQRLGLPAPDARGNGRFTMGQARSMLRQGYHIYHVQRFTGWGERAFDDMKLDGDGYLVPGPGVDHRGPVQALA